MQSAFLDTKSQSRDVVTYSYDRGVNIPQHFPHKRRELKNYAREEFTQLNSSQCISAVHLARAWVVRLQYGDVLLSGRSPLARLLVTFDEAGALLWYLLALFIRFAVGPRRRAVLPRRDRRGDHLSKNESGREGRRHVPKALGERDDRLGAGPRERRHGQRHFPRAAEGAATGEF